MLILYREEGDRILVGEDVVITVQAIETQNSSPGVFIGLQAPKSVRILRGELKTIGQNINHYMRMLSYKKERKAT